MMNEKAPDAITTVDDYIARFPPGRREILARFREVIRAEAPDARERLSWGMPTYWQGENLVHFASGKNHIGFYPSPAAVEHFAARLAGYKTSKGAIRFPVGKPIDYDLIAEITRYRVNAAGVKFRTDL